jgi:uncharacterized protein YndB with AHSA1/START domain
MARNTIHVDAPPEAVFEVLSDPRHYGNWVVGASTTRRVDGRWPQVGSVLHHSQMLLIHDTTTVVECEPGRRIRLEARARPVVVADVSVSLEPDGDGTRIVLEETVTGGLAGVLPGAVSGALIQLRNAEAVKRLKRLTEIGRALDRA